MDLIADTSLLVGLWRRQAWAVAFAEANGRSSIGLPWVVLGEFWIAATALAHERPLATRDARHFDIVPDLRLMIAEAGR